MATTLGTSNSSRKNNDKKARANIQELGEALGDLTLLDDKVRPNKKNAQTTAKDLQ